MRPDCASFKNNSRFGRLTGVEEHRIFGERDVDAGLIHFGKSGDGAFEFSFERAAVVDLFGEIAGAQIRAVEEFETDAAGPRHARAGQREPRLRQPVGRNQSRWRRFHRGGTRFPLL